jgi:hypothetical protein
LGDRPRYSLPVRKTLTVPTRLLIRRRLLQPNNRENPVQLVPTLDPI